MMDVISMNQQEQFAVKGKTLKEKAIKQPELRFWTQYVMDEKTYISTDTLEDEKWYQVRIEGKEVEISKIIIVRELSEFDFHI